MPGFDGTGPAGMGPMTGRGRGYPGPEEEYKERSACYAKRRWNRTSRNGPYDRKSSRILRWI